MPCLYGLFRRQTSQGWIVAELRAIALLNRPVGAIAQRLFTSEYPMWPSISTATKPAISKKMSLIFLNIIRF